MFVALLFPFLPWFLSSAPEPPAGPTLFPDRLRSGDEVRFVVDGVLRAAPSDDADTVAVARTTQLG